MRGEMTLPSLVEVWIERDDMALVEAAAQACGLSADAFIAMEAAAGAKITLRDRPSGAQVPGGRLPALSGPVAERVTEWIASTTTPVPAAKRWRADSSSKQRWGGSQPGPRTQTLKAVLGVLLATGTAEMLPVSVVTRKAMITAPTTLNALRYLEGHGWVVVRLMDGRRHCALTDEGRQRARTEGWSVSGGTRRPAPFPN
ncbi:hypothetical protein J7E97_13850 [Streptomyces sp. ISL-66]|uniref:hypothetical protein n=1 Tax=Streptomyces sp. ISL-66 TaxID=2819186 RepID=UPI001BE70D0A|nr:hypothetical protein [Streptomyces sp. ISL-66]MBT2468927.1 hypothetical protein [Streptomyces sp. ISL-66]